MRAQPCLLVPALATLACAILAGCTASGTSRVAHRPTGSLPRSEASSPQATGRVGSPSNPLLLSCGQESFPGYPSPPVPRNPQPGDLVIGPLYIVNGKRVATGNPSGFGDRGAYKIPFVVLPGSTVTVTIGARARGQVVITNPYAPVGGVTAASYHSCSRQTGFFAQGFAFTHGRIRGCIPLEVRVGRQHQVRRVTLSLFAGSCVT